MVSEELLDGRKGTPIHQPSGCPREKHLTTIEPGFPEPVTSFALRRDHIRYRKFCDTQKCESVCRGRGD